MAAVSASKRYATCAARTECSDGCSHFRSSAVSIYSSTAGCFEAIPSRMLENIGWQHWGFATAFFKKALIAAWFGKKSSSFISRRIDLTSRGFVFMSARSPNAAIARSTRARAVFCAYRFIACLACHQPLMSRLTPMPMPIALPPSANTRMPVFIGLTLDPAPLAKPNAKSAASEHRTDVQKAVSPERSR